ncbi:MAG: hypothetical protein QM626_10770 [Microbacterium sp.]|uniref:hypothetical protein n=1 Tax=Microbacterium sp. TaxID=51671 RepID=UPI0039E41065
MNVVRMDGSGQWLGVDWGAIGLVFVVGLVATVVIVGCYALGTRLLAVGAPDVEVPDGGDPEGPAAIVRPRRQPRPALATVGAALCYAVGIAATLYGIYLVIPAFHR